MTTESAPEAPVDPARIRQQIEALILTHEERKRHDREYLNGVIGDAKKILIDHTHTASGACAKCGDQWPCGTVEMLRSERFYVD